jgi:hypothetical protein
MPGLLSYPKGHDVSASDMAALNMEPHRLHHASGRSHVWALDHRDVAVGLSRANSPLAGPSVLTAAISEQ